ncbi:MAG: nicotinate-nucleotide adenylyltransferase [Rhodocyclaceae bacterium]|nr:nicotinate-nucleotide adenylyltransferase [Rhodocyclaceae bacterium]MDP1956725.1 nicotinate-nucleotide adenylyltransferase [Rhodocyclaceae bacterium]
MPEEPSPPIGILGGTFNPVHNAHLALAHAALDRLGLGAVLWIPAGQPPHRAAPRVAPADRLGLVQAAIASEPRFQLDASEVNNTAASYTVPTLERLRRQYGPTRPLVLLMGADAFLGLPGWYRWREIFDLAHIAVATRPGFPLVDFTPPLAGEFESRRLASADFSNTSAGGIYTFELVAGTVSATEVRGLIAAHAPDAALVPLLPPAVLDYIHQHSLYGH